MRCFIAITLTDAIRRDLSRLRTRLNAGGGGVRFTPAENLHVTLKFLGEVEEKSLADLGRALTQATGELDGFTLRLEGAGCFPPHGRPRIVWAGLVGDSERLELLAHRIEDVAVSFGFPREHRRLTPHITLARVNDARACPGLRSQVAAESGFSGGLLPVTEVVLFQSVLSRGPAQYVPLSRHPLRDPASNQGGPNDPG